MQMRSKERRGECRFRVSLPARLTGHRGAMHDCVVIELSPAGATLLCRDVQAGDVPDGGRVEVAIAGAGEFSAMILGRDEGLLRLKLDKCERPRLLNLLAGLAQSGGAKSARPRRQDRLEMTNGFFIRADGSHAPCDTLDVSLQGISLRTAARPPLGEMVRIGPFRGHVVRHHDEGVAVTFLPVATPVAVNPAAVRAYGARRA